MCAIKLFFFVCFGRDDLIPAESTEVRRGSNHRKFRKITLLRVFSVPRS